MYGGLGVGEMRRVKQLEDENRKLKQLVADQRQRELRRVGEGPREPARRFLHPPGRAIDLCNVLPPVRAVRP